MIMWSSVKGIVPQNSCGWPQRIWLFLKICPCIWQKQHFIESRRSGVFCFLNVVTSIKEFFSLIWHWSVITELYILCIIRAPAIICLGWQQCTKMYLLTPCWILMWSPIIKAWRQLCHKSQSSQCYTPAYNCIGTMFIYTDTLLSLSASHNPNKKSTHSNSVFS